MDCNPFNISLEELGGFWFGRRISSCDLTILTCWICIKRSPGTQHLPQLWWHSQGGSWGTFPDSVRCWVIPASLLLLWSLHPALCLSMGLFHLYENAGWKAEMLTKKEGMKGLGLSLVQQSLLVPWILSIRLFLVPLPGRWLYGNLASKDRLLSVMQLCLSYPSFKPKTCVWLKPRANTGFANWFIFHLLQM